MLSRDAEDDITDIYQYVAVQDSVANADRLLNRLEKSCSSFAAFPMRGIIPKAIWVNNRLHAIIHSDLKE